MPPAQSETPATMWQALATLLTPFSGKTVGGVLTGLYALGLLVTNEASIALGVADFSLPKYQGIFTGAWCTAMVLVGALPVDACYLLLTKNRPAYERLLMLPVVLAGVFYMCVLATWVILTFIGIGIGSEKHLADLPAVRLLGTPLRVPAVCVWIPAVFLAVALIVSVATQSSKPSRMKLLLVLGIGALMSTWVLATNVYPHIPKQFGGGWPDRVRITLTPQGATVWSGLCSGFKASSLTTTGTVALNYSLKDIYIVKAVLPTSGLNQSEPSTIVVRLNKSLVDAITLRPDDDVESCAPP